MIASTKLPEHHDENEVLRRMLSTPPKQHQAAPTPAPKKPAPAKKKAKNR